MSDSLIAETPWKGIERLPLIDSAVLQVSSLLDKPDSNFEQIAEKLSPDIAANFLRIANSAHYGREVRSISFAVRVLGYDQMKSMLTSPDVAESVMRRTDLKHFNFEKFQAQAYFCAAISKVLGEILGHNEPEDLYTVSILQNIGKLVLAAYFTDKHLEINALKVSEGIDGREAEMRVLGATHGEIGATVLERFNIPGDICNAIRHHDVTGRMVPDKPGFELEFVSRVTTRLVAEFALPKDMNAPDIMDRLKGTVHEGRIRYREKMQELWREGKGYRENFEILIDGAAALVRRDLRSFLGKKKR